MTLETVMPSGIDFAITNERMPESAGGISSLRNSCTHSTPYPFDTVSMPDIGLSLQEQEVLVRIRGNAGISSPKWFNQTVLDLVGLMWLPGDWSSDNPKRIERGVVQRMLGVLLTVLDPDTPPPTIVPTRRGGIQVEWHQNGIDLEIEALRSGSLEYFFNGPTGEQEGTVERDVAILKQFVDSLKTPRPLT